jgi:hypothetical protein
MTFPETLTLIPWHGWASLISMLVFLLTSIFGSLYKYEKWHLYYYGIGIAIQITSLALSSTNNNACVNNLLLTGGIIVMIIPNSIKIYTGKPNAT